MSNDNAGRSPRTTGGTGPVGSTVAIVVTAVALVLGFLILREINDDSDDTGSGGNTEQSTTTSSDPNSTTSTSGSTTTTTTPLVTDGSSVMVANCSTQNGVAGQMSLALEGVGFTMAEPTNGTVKLATSKVLYDSTNPDAKAVADSVAQVLGGIPVETTGLPIPAGDGTWPADTSVVVMLGDDLAGKTLDQINGVEDSGTTTAPSTT